MPFHFQILTRGRMSYLDRYFYIYRIRSNSIINTAITDDKLIDFFLVHKEIYIIIKNNNLNKTLFFVRFFYSFRYRFSDYQIQNIETAKNIISIIKEFDIITLFNIQDKKVFFFFRAGFRMTPENYWDYLNKKTVKNKNKEIIYIDNVIKELDNAVKYRDDVIKNFDNAVKHRDNVIKELDNAVKHRDNVIKELDNAVKYRDDVIKELE